MLNRIKRAATPLLLALALGLVSWGGAEAQSNWPEGPIKIIVPYKAGGSVDRTARNLAPFLSDELGVPVVVENLTGGGGQVAALNLLAQPADGNTIMMHAQPYFSAAIILQGASFSLEDFHVLNVQNVGNISITVKSDSLYTSFDDLHKAIKANPGKLSVGFPRGGSAHLLVLLLADRLGWDVRMVPYESGAPVRTAILGGQLTFSANGAVSDAAMKPEIRSLALSTSTPISMFSDSPPLNEVLKSYDVEVPELGDVRFLAVKMEVRAEYPKRVETLSAAIEAAMQSGKFREVLRKQGSEDETAYRGQVRSLEIVKGLNDVMRTYKSAFQK